MRFQSKGVPTAELDDAIVRYVAAGLGDPSRDESVTQMAKPLTDGNASAFVRRRMNALMDSGYIGHHKARGWYAHDGRIHPEIELSADAPTNLRELILRFRGLQKKNVRAYELVAAAVEIAANAERARDIAVGALNIAIAHGRAGQGEMRRAA